MPSALSILMLLIILCSTSAAQDVYFKNELTNVQTFFQHFFAKKIPEKSKYETDEQYYERIKPLDNVDSSKRYYFQLPIQTDYAINDSTVYINFGSYYNPNDAFTLMNISIELNENKTRSGSYVGSNAFGVKKEIDVVKVVKRSLSHMTIDSVYLQYDTLNERIWKFDLFNKNVLEYQFKVLPLEAQKVEPLLSCAVECQFLSLLDRDIQVSASGTPTIDEPVKISTTEYSIGAVLKSITIFNKKSKKIFAKFTVYGK